MPKKKIHPQGWLIKALQDTYRQQQISPFEANDQGKHQATRAPRRGDPNRKSEY
jgi:hypothetical protein